MSASQYANPANKGAMVNKLDFVVLAALEIDTGFNVNVLTGSDGVLRGAPGGHPDTAGWEQVLYYCTPLVRGRMATLCQHVVTVSTPGGLRGRFGDRLRHRGQPHAAGFDCLS